MKRRMFTRIGGVCLALLVAVLLIVSCTPKTTPSPAPSPSAPAPTTAKPAPAPLPKVITMTTLAVGSSGYVLSSAAAAAIKAISGMEVRLESQGTDTAKFLPVKNKEAQLILTGAGAYFAALGTKDTEFDRPEWGPQPVRLIWAGSPQIGGLVVWGDSPIKTLKDLKGSRFSQTPGLPSNTIPAYACLAFAGLTPADVKIVTFGSYTDQAKGVLEGTADTIFAYHTTAAVKEIEASRHGVRWLPLPADDKEGWARALKLAPYWTVEKQANKGPGLANNPTDLTGTKYNIGSYDHLDENIAYAVTKSLKEGYDILKAQGAGPAEWTLEEALRVPAGETFPYHPGSVRYFKEIGVWTPALDKWQQEQLAAEKARLKK